MAERQLLTPQQVAERLQISRWTVMDSLRAGRLKGRKIGKFWRIEEQDLEAFIRGSEGQPDAFEAIDRAMADTDRQ